MRAARIRAKRAGEVVVQALAPLWDISAPVLALEAWYRDDAVTLGILSGGGGVIESSEAKQSNSQATKRTFERPYQKS